ncbi:MAG: argininosuccinate lyase [Planctomycetota bacterium]|nr:argininosuccinate lyase [Planctomycetota bacterium]
MTKLWGGRFAGESDPRFFEWQKSLPHDVALLAADITGSMAWAKALVDAGVLKPNEGRRITDALAEIFEEADEVDSKLVDSDAEDVHSLVETELGRRVGDLAKRLHTGRSRTDQVATDLKLFLRELLVVLDERLRDLMIALVDLADANSDLAIPGYTHMQRAQPITAGHHALAYVQMLSRDRDRVGDTIARMDSCPLGSGALAGTAFPVDREEIARDLGFAMPTRNSLDAVSDRDHLAEALFTCSLISVHLSRLAEDWIFFSSHEAGFLELSDAIATGSSLMPQKKNPDGFELLRGKSGRAIGELTGFLATLKGLPMAYDRDLQEDKQALLLGVPPIIEQVEIATLLVRNVRYRADRCRAAAEQGGMNATDLADLLVKTGVAFRTAHERAGTVVRAALEHGCEIQALPRGVLADLVPELDGLDLTHELSVEAVLARRDVIGGTAPSRVREEVDAWKQAFVEELEALDAADDLDDDEDKVL